jgi:hypothetical protein
MVVAVRLSNAGCLPARSPSLWVGVQDPHETGESPAIRCSGDVSIQARSQYKMSDMTRGTCRTLSPDLKQVFARASEFPTQHFRDFGVSTSVPFRSEAANYMRPPLRCLGTTGNIRAISRLA